MKPIMPLVASLIVLCSPARADDVTVSGSISLGSSMGIIAGGARDYVYGSTTRNLAILMNGCPIRMGEIVPCVVKFKAQGDNITEIIAANPPSAGAIGINKPGSVFDAFVCDHPTSVSYQARPGCQHFDNLLVHVLVMNKEFVQLRWNGMNKYALSQRVMINCQGTSISLAAYVGNNLPPGISSC